KGNLLSLGDKTGFVFSMRTSPYWVFSQENTDLDISLPATVVVKSISSMSSNELMPAISFSNSGFLGTKGFTHLSRKDPRTTIS
ncbi:hypothetical protein, partial [Klebsiella pneumoniae]|uniref:hypothetical protein n=1 Tax=Klebsiella pneumoniae TaxID=573 RepID=UPI003B97D00E